MEYDHDYRDFESREADDKHTYVKFYIHPVKDEEKSAAEGRPVYKDREYVEIRTPGQQNNVIRRPVTEIDAKRFRRAYQMFKEGNEEQIVGTPLSEMPWVTRSQVEEMAHIRIRTVEQLSVVGDDVCTRMAGLYGLKDKALKYLEHAAKMAPITEVHKLREDFDNQLEAMQKTIDEQAATIKALQQKKA